MPAKNAIRFAQAIVQSATNAASLTRQLLAFARRQPLKPERIDLNELIGEMDELLDRAMGERCRIARNLDPQRSLQLILTKVASKQEEQAFSDLNHALPTCVPAG